LSSPDEDLRVNRANWDERAGIHLESRFYDVEGWLREGRGPRVREVEALGDVTGLRLLHLQCHFGKDTLSWARAGACVTGLDFSASAVEAARDLALRAGLEDRSEFVCSDVYEARRALRGATYDIVYVSLGALCWLPDVDRWAEQVGSLVAPGGRFYIHDVHPLAWSLADDGLVLEHTYFEEAEPYVSESEDSYTDSTRPLENRKTYEWNHSIGEIVSALVRHGLRIERLVEHDWTVLQRFAWLVPEPGGNWTSPPGSPRLPLTFTLLASQPSVLGPAQTPSLIATGT
jgi:phthiocerol/phenolphthiocerol synthesis type-I polyketide synthase E